MAVTTAREIASAIVWSSHWRERLKELGSGEMEKLGLQQNLWVENRLPSLVQWTTVLARVKASLASLGGCAGRDADCAAWW